jgi:hypothetical protein
MKKSIFKSLSAFTGNVFHSRNLVLSTCSSAHTVTRFTFLFPAITCRRELLSATNTKRVKTMTFAIVRYYYGDVWTFDVANVSDLEIRKEFAGITFMYTDSLAKAVAIAQEARWNLSKERVTS